ncbi:hypothetical protein B0J12DRAFT_714548 [Macrophomina phaseolina]|uniref:Lysozyme-like domain-containing protein n=1 Tax=Macrophomina phaseolina TaxID=35725 RepID=A0ABQ8FSB4_9PEZI|nr:hypothetical protein B0J12DRAFT_714548 [Macrophomina phaseolina]
MQALLNLFFITIASAHAIPLQGRAPPVERTSTTEEGRRSLVTIAPGTSSCHSASVFIDECRTASEAAQPILDSFDKYQIANTNERAALIALMLYESGEFKYNWSHFVNGEISHMLGKGTRNMQSAKYNEEYARTLFPSEEVDSAKSSGGADGVLQLVSRDSTSFASAAWFLVSQCDSSVRSGLQAGTRDGLERYVSDCIGGTIDQSRLDYWTKTKAALSDG